MKETLREKMYIRFLEVLEKDENLKLDDITRRRICVKLSSASTDIEDDNARVLKKLYSELVLSYENNRTQFIEMINVIEKSSKFIIGNFKSKSLAKFEYNALSRKTELKANSSVLQDVVSYFNVMNDVVIKFYKEVYQIEKMKPNETDIKQKSLF